tara:strand:+ start:350 stop:613 length:264 start_codon:yes stop_codon:yes gene_type:complete
MEQGAKFKPEIIRVSDLPNIFNLSRSTIYNHINQNLLPKPFSLGAGSAGFLREEIYSLLKFISTSPTLDERREFVSNLPSQRAANEK